MAIYNWQQADWPHFRYELTELEESLLAIAQKTGFIKGKLAHLSKELQTETMINLMVEEAVKTSEIEGEYISRPDIRSSINNKLKITQETIKIHDKRAQGVVELMFDVRNSFDEPLSETKLFDWHLMLLSSSPNPNLRVGCFRTHEEPMQVVSGQAGKWTIHYEAPPSAQVPQEMAQFLDWFNKTAPGQLNAIHFAPVRAAIAHLYFESIHPFEDGNGRIGRAIAEKALSQGFGYPAILSLSQAIERDKKAYYSALNAASKTNEISAWIRYFVNLVSLAQAEVELEINFILKKSEFFDGFSNDLNERELRVLRRMMQAGPAGFAGGMSAKKYMNIADTSKATATRDLQHLVMIGALRSLGSGRSIRYELNC